MRGGSAQHEVKRVEPSVERGDGVFSQRCLAVLWDRNKARPSEHSQPPLTVECFSGGWTRLLSKQSADSLINRGVCRGARRSIFSHLLTLVHFTRADFYVPLLSPEEFGSS